MNALRIKTFKTGMFDIFCEQLKIICTLSPVTVCQGEPKLRNFCEEHDSEGKMQSLVGKEMVRHHSQLVLPPITCSGHL